MKRLLTSILLFAAFLCGAQAQNDALFVYRNDGAIHGFLRADIDSMVCSQIDLDSLMHADYVVQEIWTADSVYRIPLAAIDSISFVTPPTIYKEGVTKIEESLLPYVVGADSLTLKLKSDTPSYLLPQTGDLLVLLEGCEVLPYGFAGKVENVNTLGDCVEVVCEQTYIEDVFDSFCSVQTMAGYAEGSENASSQRSPSRPDRITYNPDDKVFHLGPYTFSLSKELSQGLTPDGDLALKGGANASINFSPTFRIHTLVILGEGRGLLLDCSVKGSLSISSLSSFYGELELEHEYLNPEIKCPIANTAGLVNFYLNPGLFMRGNATLTSTVKDDRTYEFGMSYGYSSNGENVTEPSLGGRMVSTSTDVEGSIDGSVAMGVYLEAGFNFLSRYFARTCVRGEMGMQLNGNFVLRNSDIEEAESSTVLYERLKASSLEWGAFVNASLIASVAHTQAGMTWQMSGLDDKWNLVPTFSNTKLTHTPGSATSVDAYTELSGNCLRPMPVGYKLFDADMNEIADYDAPLDYANQASSLEYSFGSLNQGEDYTVYPTVKFFGYEMLATPSAEISNTRCPDGNHPHAIDLGLPSGTKWCCCNVGAASPEGYGGYYAWGETGEKSVYNRETYAYYDKVSHDYVNIGSDISGTQYDVARVRMGAPWRMPTHEQQVELMTYCKLTWTQQNGVNGNLVTGPNGGQIFFPAAGYRWDDSLHGVGSSGYYWSSSLYPNYDDSAYYLDFIIGGWFWFYYDRDYGRSVRPVCP